MSDGRLDPFISFPRTYGSRCAYAVNSATRPPLLNHHLRGGLIGTLQQLPAGLEPTTDVVSDTPRHKAQADLPTELSPRVFQPRASASNNRTFPRPSRREDKRAKTEDEIHMIMKTKDESAAASRPSLSVSWQCFVPVPTSPARKRLCLASLVLGPALTAPPGCRCCCCRSRSSPGASPAPPVPS